MSAPATALLPPPIGTDRRSRFVALLGIYRLLLASPADTGDAARLAGHPEVAAARWRLEADWLAELESDTPPAELLAAGPVAALRRIAATHRRHPVYDWLAERADRRGMVQFLALEGGPDSGFDDLVALAQVGLAGPAKLELARNYWDEMGGGRAAEVHRTLYARMATALGIPTVPLEGQPEPALERGALDGLLATNRWLQPELVGALGMTELQAGPRCRMVLKAFDRLRVDPDAAAFYRVHAEVDPRHGRDWLEHAVAPLAGAHPDWAPRMVRGAWWRARINARFFTDVARRLRAQ